MARIINKAIFPVAGLGTAFLPVTKASPKVMLPIVDKPLIQYAVEEAIAAGFKELIFITSSSKRAIEDHFDCNYELESTLEQRGKLDLLKIVRDIIPADVTCAYIRQTQPLGLGHAVLCAKNLIRDEPFAVLLADDLIEEGPQGCLNNMMNLFDQTHSSIIAMEKIPHYNTKKYGIVALCDKTEKHRRVSSIIEKPAPEQAPSNLAVVGRYIFQPTIFKALESTPKDRNGELQLTDAISQLLIEEAFYGYYLTGKRYDCGSKLGFVQATINYALQHPDVTDAFAAYLREQITTE